MMGQEEGKTRIQMREGRRGGGRERRKERAREGTKERAAATERR